MSDTEKTKLREEVSDIPSAERNLHRSLTRISHKVAREMENADMSTADLADELGKNEDYVHRLLGGGINLSLRTIMELESVLETDLIETKKVGSTGNRRRRSM